MSLSKIRYGIRTNGKMDGKVEGIIGERNGRKGEFIRSFFFVGLFMSVIVIFDIYNKGLY